jgi:2-polyprenyl-3-methyl-5-hydroxy-6-metoxy-1,4-benzoquinol methylase
MQDGGNNALSTNYYKDLWNDPNTEAGQFFNKVDFNHKDYKDQEQVFRNFLKGLRAVKTLYEDQKPIETVLEIGIGKGRMSKIMLEEFPDIQIYNAVDINFFPIEIDGVDIYNADATDEMFFENINSYYNNRRWDLILASEFFMHVKPEHIERVIKSVTDLLAPQGVIINIDWATDPMPSNWCYIHNYDQIYETNGLYPVFEATINKQKLFCYGK